MLCCEYCPHGEATPFFSMLLILSVPRVDHFCPGIASAWYKTAAKVDFVPMRQGFCAHCHDEEAKPFFSMEDSEDEVPNPKPKPQPLRPKA